MESIKNNPLGVQKTTYESRLKPMSIKAYKSRALAAEKDIKAGRVIDLEALKKESEQW